MLAELEYLNKIIDNRKLKIDPYKKMPLLNFIVETHKKMFNEKFIVKNFHEEICHLLTQAALRKSDKYITIINMPPRYSKTQIMSYYVMWCFLKNEMARFIYSTYSHKLSLKISREIKKGLINIHRKKAAFSKDSAELWETNAGGGFWAATMGGSVTGFGAGDIYASPYSGDLIIDDPQKPFDAYFSTYRKNLVENFSNTFWSRRNNQDKIPIIVVQQRVHTDDLSGWIINDSGYPYNLYKIKALDENDNPTFPERVSKKTLLELKNAAPHTFDAQQQQDPRSYVGSFFQKIWFEIVDVVPSNWTHAVRYWDRAATKPHDSNQDPDWTRGLLMYKYPQGYWLVADLKSIRDTPLQVEKLVKSTAQHDSQKIVIVGEQDPGSAGVADAQSFARMLAGFVVKLRKPTQDKATRARAVAAQSEAGNIKVLKAAWNYDFFAELEEFPTGKHDDIVDVLSGAFNELAQTNSIFNVL
jgi:predicted phage terminase large subunit-like protein